MTILDYEKLMYRAYAFLVLSLQDAGYQVLESNIGRRDFFVVTKADKVSAVTLTQFRTLKAARESAATPAPELRYLALPVLQVSVFCSEKANKVVLAAPAALGLPEGSPQDSHFMRRLEQWMRRKNQGELRGLVIETVKEPVEA